MIAAGVPIRLHASSMVGAFGLLILNVLGTLKLDLNL